jgi:hypothetical protein
VFFHSGLCALDNPTNAKIITLKRDAVHTWVILHSMKNSGDLHEYRPTILMLCLFSNLLIQAKFIWMYSRKATKAGFSPTILLLTG